MEFVSFEKQDAKSDINFSIYPCASSSDETQFFEKNISNLCIFFVPFVSFCGCNEPCLPSKSELFTCFQFNTIKTKQKQG